MKNALTLDELKAEEMYILAIVDKFCEMYNIHYSLCGGTLIGAIRHKGFIPWDDDIDIMMTRENYTKFINNIEKFSDEINIVTYKNDKNYNYMHSKVCSKRTIYYDDTSKTVEKLGAFIDIFPIDFLGDTYNGAVKNIKKIRFAKYVGVASNWKCFFINQDKKIFRQIPRLLFYFLSKFVNVKKKYKKIEKRIENYSNTRYSGILAGVYDIKEIFESDVFANYIKVKFEDNEFWIIKEYDIYLKKLYGDYLQLPPVEKRKTHHHFQVYYRD